MRYKRIWHKRKGHEYEAKCFTENNEMDWFYFHADNMHEAYQMAQISGHTARSLPRIRRD